MNKTLPVVAALWAAVALGCIFGEDGSDRKARSGALTVTVILDKIGTLGKTAKPADIVMSTLVLTATSADEDTLRETLTLTPGSGEYNVKRTFSGLASEKTWSLSAVARDTAGAVIYSADTSFAVVPNATHDITVTLAARYSMLKARLFPIGDKVTSLLMRVNDSLAATAAFAKGSKSGDTVVLAYDYLAASPSGTPHSVRLDVRGDWYGTDTLMYRGDTVITVVSGRDRTYDLTLHWVGPSVPPPGHATINVVLGARGTILLNGHLQDPAGAAAP